MALFDSAEEAMRKVFGARAGTARGTAQLVEAASGLQGGHAGGADRKRAHFTEEDDIAWAASLDNDESELASSSGGNPAKQPKISATIPAGLRKKVLMQGAEAEPSGTIPESMSAPAGQEDFQQQMMAMMSGMSEKQLKKMMAMMSGMQGMDSGGSNAAAFALQGKTDGEKGGMTGTDPAASAASMGGRGAMGAGSMPNDPMAAPSAMSSDSTAAMNPMMAAFAQSGGSGDPNMSETAKAQLMLQYEAMQAQQVQLAIQSQFHAQMRSWENSKEHGTGLGVLGLKRETRFQNGYRPTQLCKKFFLNMSCGHGDACTFAHEYEELHPASAELIDTQRADGVLAEQKVEDFETTEPHMRMKKKREMCKRFQNTGECLLFARCMFAHTNADLGKVELVYDDRVKTEICEKWKTGKCVFGRYCPRAHGMEMIGRLKPPEDICRMSQPIRPKGQPPRKGMPPRD